MISVHLLPNLMTSEKAGSASVAHGESAAAGIGPRFPDASSVAVIIDILRASTSMATALQNGCVGIRACATPGEAFDWKAQSSPGTVLLGGERGGVRIDGFDLGNSPAEYDEPTVRGKQIVFTTTNGTRALLRSVSAGTVLVGCFLNRSALLGRLRKHTGDIHLVCAGTDGIITGEDVLFAGAITELLLAETPTRKINDSAEIARRCWRDVTGSDDEESAIEAYFRTTRGGLNLLELGFDQDLHRCSRVDTLSAVPTYDHSSGMLK
ncbi:MAG: 2-phosphosulfolactate phosphatase [Planctomycetaceae bacterium]